MAAVCSLSTSSVFSTLPIPLRANASRKEMFFGTLYGASDVRQCAINSPSLTEALRTTNAATSSPRPADGQLTTTAARPRAAGSSPRKRNGASA